MTPYQKCIQWPQKVRNRCFDLYLQNYTAKEIEKMTGVAASTLYDWSYSRERGKPWTQLRRETVVNYEERAKQLLNTSIFGIATASQTCSKLLLALESTLDKGNDSKELKTVDLSSEDLKNIATALEKSADVLLRIFGK